MIFISRQCLCAMLIVLIWIDMNESGRVDWSVEKDPSFWNEQARLSIDNLLHRQENKRLAKNVILFLGDGMGVSTVTAGRIRKGQMQGQLGEDFETVMEQFPHTGFVKTYNIDHQTPDSAGTATAFLCGVKAPYGTAGVDGRAQRKNCSSSVNAHASSILKWAQQAGKKVGIVTTARITHATPSAAYAHTADRDWEAYDTKNFGAQHVKDGCLDIAHQLLLHSPPINLVFGGGRSNFYPVDKPDVEYSGRKGIRTDNRSLIEELWRGRYLWNKTELDKISLGSEAPLMGLFEYSHMQYETDRLLNHNDEPSLSQMTQFAIEHFLAMNSTGFFLLVEGGKIDHGHHLTQPRYALDEFAEFDSAIGKAKEILKGKNVLDDTLLVVTADHSHQFTFGAYSARGSNIFGFSTFENRNVSDIDHLPINIISYGNGPNYPSPRNATYLSNLNTNATSYRAPAALPLIDEAHGGEDVPVYAHGPWSHLFIGTMEQHTIPHKMAYAACWGPYAKRIGCESTVSSTTTTSTSVMKSQGSDLFSEQNTIKIICLIWLIAFCELRSF